MQTFDQALFDLYKIGKISYEEALRNADSTNELRLQIKLAEGADLNQGGLSLESKGDEDDEET
jgi:twitching motility protein PilU